MLRNAQNCCKPAAFVHGASIKSSNMSMSGTRESGRVQNMAKRGAHFVRESGNKKVTKNCQNTSSVLPAPDSQRDIGTPLGGFSQIFRHHPLGSKPLPFRMYTTTQPREGKRGRTRAPLPNTLRDSRLRARLEESTGGQGGRGCRSSRRGHSKKKIVDFSKLLVIS